MCSKGCWINLGKLMSRLRKNIRHFYFLPHFLILLSTWLPELYGKDTLQMGEIELALLSYEKTRKIEDNSRSALVAYAQNRRERNVVKGSSSRSRSKSKNCEKCSATSVRCGDTKQHCPTWDKDSQGLESSTTVAGNTEDPGDILTIFREDTYSQGD